jgi:hypothetical protein
LLLKVRRREAQIAALIMTAITSLVTFSGCADTGTTMITTTVETTETATGSAGLAYWEANNPGSEWIRLAGGELNGDAEDDLVVVYRTEEDKYLLAALLKRGDEFQATNTIPAPVSDQVITIFDMDGKSPKEILISGRKGKNAGSAVLRVEKGELNILFSSGYGNCCG